jgi:hypothetical protein
MPKSAVPDDFEQLKVSFIDPIQHDYEAIRPVVLGADTLSARSHQVQIDRTVLGDKARRFLAQGVDVPLHMCGVQAYGGAESEPPISQNERTRYIWMRKQLNVSVRSATGGSSVG